MTRRIEAADDAGPPSPCHTRTLLTGRPDDLMPWAEAAASLAHTPCPISERNLRRIFRADGRYRTWPPFAGRGELVSMSDVFAVHRDWVASRSVAAQAA